MSTPDEYEEWEEGGQEEEWPVPVYVLDEPAGPPDSSCCLRRVWDRLRRLVGLERAPEPEEVSEPEPEPSVRRGYKPFTVWMAREQIYLVSPTASDPLVWVPQPDGTWRLRVECYRERPCPDVPEVLCYCGIHATYHFGWKLHESAFIGLVRPVGKTIPEEYGWRAEAAVVELLGAPSEMIPDLPEDLRRRVCTYDVLQRAAERPLRVSDSRPLVPAQPDLEVEPEIILRARVLDKYGSELEATWGRTRVVRSYDRQHGRPHSEYWYSPSFWKDWALGRQDGPAIVIYDDEGRVRREEWYDTHWYERRQRHREDGPAVVEYDPDGTIYRAWYRRGRLLWAEELRKRNERAAIRGG